LSELELSKIRNHSGRGAMLNISLPNQITEFIQQQAISDGFSTPSEYVVQLILREQERLGQQARVESLLIEGLDSGTSIAVTDDWWNTKRAALDLRHRS
jgi:antitoxin ParD1/3/4